MIQFDSDRCVNCRICEAVCSYRWMGSINATFSAITLERHERFGTISANVCEQCGNANCADACPTGALYQENGLIKFEKSECTGCKVCADVCPKAHFDEKSGTLIICDMCGGDPLCVKWCPEKALTASK